MKRKSFILLLFTLFASLNLQAKWDNAKWITAQGNNVDEANTWISFRKDFSIDDKIPSMAEAVICADSKYWLWINGEMAVFEGGLKRGPNRTDSYYDIVDIAPFLRKGNNRMEILVWHFGKSGFSHIDSGRSGLLFSAPAIGLVSDSQWVARLLPEYGTCGEPLPNYRLSESSICYDARKELPEHVAKTMYKPAREVGLPGDAPWNKLHERPIPLFKNFGLKTAKYVRHEGEKEDTLVARLPYNMQITPAITLDDVGGTLIKLQTNHIRVVDGEYGVRAEYITKPGSQTYESLGWMNGEELHVILPHGMKIKKLQYRESGYDTWAEGTFSSDDPFINRFWKKALNTLYVNMRDTYYDCPERERAQWWGDVCVLMRESFYTYSTSAHRLMRKGMLELCAFQKPDGVIYSPIPGIWDSELPAQMLSSVGLYGFWNYYMNTGDLETIKKVYPAVKKYLDVWKIEEGGLTAERHGGWDWGDWGDHRDIRLIYAAWHYMALDAASRMALLQNLPAEAEQFRKIMARVKLGYNACWNGEAYRHPSYTGDTDDRVQALAVISGIASADKYPQIINLLHTQKHASPYMEKYVLEALFMLGQGEYAIERMKERFAEMVNSEEYTTLYEGWGVGKQGFGGGTSNHAWSGGPLTVISQELMGISPVEPGWSLYSVDPQIVVFNNASITVPTVKGKVGYSFKKKGDAVVHSLDVPHGSCALFYLPENASFKEAKYICSKPEYQKSGKVCLLLPEGRYKFKSLAQ